MPMNVRVVVETAQRPFFLVLLAILDMSQRFDRTVSQGHPCQMSSPHQGCNPAHTMRTLTAEVTIHLLV